MDEETLESWGHRTILFFLFLFSFFLFMFGNQIVTLTHPDEVFYAETAKEMIQHDSWMTPYIFDAPQFEKPIFFYWLLMLGFKLWGQSAFVARFWPAAFGILGVLLTYWISFVLFQKKKTAFLSALVLSTSLVYLILSRSVLTDMVFSVWVTLSIGFFIYGYWNPARKNISILMFFISAALAVLTKGVLGIIFPLGLVIIFLLFKRDFVYLKCWPTFLGLVFFLGIAIPWHVLMYQLYGNRFLEEYWGNVHLRRIFEAEHAKSNTWHFYPMTLFVGCFPWTVFIIPSIILVVRAIFPNPGFSAGEGAPKIKEELKILVFWVFFVYVVVQSAQSKLASYILPAFPPLAMIIGYFLASVSHREGGENTFSINLFRKSVSFLLVVFVFFSVAAIGATAKFSSMVPDRLPAYVFSGLTLLLLFLVWYCLSRKKYFQTIFFVSCFHFIILFSLGLGSKYAEPWVSCEMISTFLKNQGDYRNSTILVSKFYLRGVRYYTNSKEAVIDINGKGFFSPHPIPFLNTDDKVLNFFESQNETYCVLKRSNVEDVERIAKGKFQITHIKDVGGKFLIKVVKLNRHSSQN